MWKYLLLTLLLGVELKKAKSNDEDLDGTIIYDDVLYDNIRRKCLKAGNKTIYTVALYERDECTRRYYTELTTDENVITRVCSNYCFEELLERVDECLGAEEKFLHQFLTESKKEQCKNNGKELADKLRGVFDECPNTPKPILEDAVAQLCFPKLRFMHHKSEPDFTWTLSDVCSDCATLQNCIVEVVIESCGNDKFVKYATVFLEPYLNWCEKNSNDLK